MLFNFLGLSIVILNLLIPLQNTVATDITDDDLINEYLYPSSSDTTTDDNSSSTNPPETTTVATTVETTTISEPCKCVPYYLCDLDTGTIIKDGSRNQLIDARVDLPADQGKPSQCKNNFEICCKPEIPQNSTTEAMGPTVATFATTNSTETPTTAQPQPEYKHFVCGKRNIDGIGLRTMGPETQTQFGEFPWMIIILKMEKSEKTNQLSPVFVCGGSLIHPKVVLTAAHCVFGKPKSKLTIRVGEWDTQSNSEIYPHEDRAIANVIVHKDFQAGSLYNDIALLILTEPIDFAPNIDTVCLSPTNFDFNGKKCFVSGFGKDSFGQKGSYQTIMRKVELGIVDNDKCQRELRKTRLGDRFRLHNSFVCAGGDSGQDTCQGDGGSPLVCQLPNSPYYIQYGIVAWGIGCGGETPGVYAYVPKFLPWITEQFTTHNLETSYYKNLF